MLECNSNYDSVLKTQGTVSVYKIPTDPVRREKWLKLIPRKNWNITTSSVVCVKHFKEKFLERYEIGKDGQQILYKTPRLKRNARPTLFGEDLEEVDHSETEEESEDEAVGRQLTKLKKPVQEFPKPTTPGQLLLVAII
jgi:THAP domain